MLRRRALPLLLLAMLTAAWPAAGDHAQTEGGRVVVFDHKTGNAWWVEVILSGPDGGQVSGVSARDDGGAWVPLTFRSWGAWGASFHIEPGHRVQFRADWPGGAQALSCWFTHPAGAEQCEAPPGTFDATFTLVKGNAWWVQSQVTPDPGHTVAAVHVSLNGGPWQPLDRMSWGVREWARSYHIPEGTIVQLRATSTTGATDVSACYRWIPPQTGGADAPQVPCTGPAPPPPAFHASFSNVRGNNWWVEVDVVGDFGVAGVEFRMDAGPWRSMARQSWGSWARGGLFVPDDTLVQFRARSTHGAVDFSNPGWLWAGATPSIEQVPPSTPHFLAEFTDPAGSAHWVRFNVLANQEVAGVDWRVAGAAGWNPLAREASGFWNATAASPIPEGAEVEVRARNAAGAEQTASGPWPPWPQPGSWAEYRHIMEDFHADGTYEKFDVYAILTAVPGGWDTRCDMVHTFDPPGGEPSQTFSSQAMGRPGPLVGPVEGIAAGDQAGVDFLSRCFRTGFAIEVTGAGPHETSLRTTSGDPVTLEAWHGQETWDGTDPNGWDVWWDTTYGLVLDWQQTDFVGSHGALARRDSWGWLVNTDAPLR